MTYQPTYISGYETGLVQSRQNFILPADAYPTLENAFVWRERIQRKSGSRLLGRLARSVSGAGISLLSPFIINVYTFLGISLVSEPNAQIQPGSIEMTIGPETYTDNGNGILIGVPTGFVTVDYVTGQMNISTAQGPGNPINITINYYPGLPCMGLRTRDLNNINAEQCVAFDTKYAYKFVTGWEEFIAGAGSVTWTGNDSDFFWTTNYWVGDNNQKIFWVTNNSGPNGDPIRYTNGTNWVSFAPQINVVPEYLWQCLALLPFRGRFLAFNTYEGETQIGSIQYRQRIRWSAIGTPFTIASTVVTTGLNVEGWRDDIKGRGGFLDIPTSENIVCVGFVRDNLVIYCESSTWQLRYTGKSISPFQIEKVNTELGAESTFSAVQFDTSLVGIGDKGVVECDSYKSNRIDIKIPDIVYGFNNENNGLKRVYGIRDFQQRLAYWTFPTNDEDVTFPNRRLVYNYENDSWAIFVDSYTCLGFFQSLTAYKWQDFPPSKETNQWQNLNFPWVNRPTSFPAIVGGNQQGYVEYLGQLNFETGASNDVSLSISDITGNDPNPTVITSINHNLENDQIIEITGIPTGTPFASTLNQHVFQVNRLSADTFNLYIYDADDLEFSIPQVDPSGDYIGGGEIIIRDNFRIVSKKFNFIEQGQAIQFGFMDILMDSTSEGAVTMNMYLDYNENQSINSYPNNIVETTNTPDTFFNTVIPTFTEVNNGSSKNWQRVYCSARGAFITLEFTLSNAQMVGNEQKSDVQIDSQILWMRPAGKQLARGI